jgi:hypothetical protein
MALWMAGRPVSSRAHARQTCAAMLSPLTKGHHHDSTVGALLKQRPQQRDALQGFAEALCGTSLILVSASAMTQAVSEARTHAHTHAPCRRP